MTQLERSYYLNLDANDPLAALRHEFALPDNTIYLDGNSLGALPKSAITRAQEVIQQEWGTDLIKSWNTAGWFELPSRLGNLLAPLIGASEDEVVITDSTSINLFKAIAAAIKIQHERVPHRKIIVSERNNFPTDLYMAQGISEWLDRGYQLRLIDSPEQLSSAVDGDCALVMLTHVNYRTGYQHDLKQVTHLTHERGALILWDLAHSAGAVPVELNESNADIAVGCCYKYLNGGPGAPAFIWVSKRLQNEFQHPLSGWWGHKRPFEMQSSFAPTDGIRRALCGTQGILSLALIECGLEIFSKTSMQAIRKKSLALTSAFITLVEDKCAQHNLTLETPREENCRGSQVSFSHPHGYAIMQALIARGVIGDYREPGIIRFGFTPLYTRFSDVWDAAECLREILDNRLYSLNQERNTVT